MTGAGVSGPSLSVVVPVYNSAGSLEALAQRVDEAVGDREYELVLVNDGSADGAGSASSSWLAVTAVSTA